MPSCFPGQISLYTNVCMRGPTALMLAFYARLLCPPFMPALLGVAALHRPAYTVDLGRRATSCLFILPHTHPLFLHALFLFRFLFPISFSQRKLYCFGRHFILSPSQLGPWRLIQLRGVTPLFLLNLKKTQKKNPASNGMPVKRMGNELVYLFLKRIPTKVIPKKTEYL